ncbi:MAG: prenyltransferase [Cytophagales bacterium]|nr:MAG: prenyltransferase [Cytophagales bacterium]
MKTLPNRPFWWAFLQLIRWNNLLIIAFTQYLAYYQLIINQGFEGWGTPPWGLVFCIVATLCIAAAGYVINDYYDIKIDNINKPDKVIIGRYIARREAIIFNFSLNCIGLFLAWKVSFYFFLASLTCAFFLWLYSNYLKRLPVIGNIVIALLSAMSLLIISFYNALNWHLVAMFGLFAFFISFIREIIKDMEDIRGDARFGCKTLPILWGIRRTKRVIYVLLLSFSILILSTFFTFYDYFTLYLYISVLPALLVLTYQLMYADRKKKFRELSQLCKLIMILGILSMLLA